MKQQVKVGNKTRDSEESNASGNNLINVNIILTDPLTLGTCVFHKNRGKTRTHNSTKSVTL